MYRTMTQTQLQKACKEHKYLALRYRDGCVIGLNCKVANVKKDEVKPGHYTRIVSVEPISFMKYISIKTPFL